MTIRKISLALFFSVFSFGAVSAHAADASHAGNHSPKCWESQRGDPSLPAEKLAVPCKPGQHGLVRNNVAISDTEPAQRGDANAKPEYLPNTTK